MAKISLTPAQVLKLAGSKRKVSRRKSKRSGKKRSGKKKTHRRHHRK